MNYLRKRYDRIDMQLSDKMLKDEITRREREEEHIKTLAWRKEKQTSIKDLNIPTTKRFDDPQLRPFIVSKPKIKFDKRKELIRDRFGEYFVKVDRIDELCKLLTPEEIDSIAEHPNFFFPNAEENGYKDLVNVDKWNQIADELMGRKPLQASTIKITQNSFSLPALKRKPPATSSSSKALKPVNHTSTARKTVTTQSPTFYPAPSVEEEIVRRRMMTSNQIHEKLQKEFLRNAANKLEEEKKWEEAQITKLDQIELKNKTAIEKRENQIKIRNQIFVEKVKRHEDMRQKHQERLELQIRDEEMVQLNEKIKDMCKCLVADKKKSSSPGTSEAGNKDTAMNSKNDIKDRSQQMI